MNINLFQILFFCLSTVFFIHYVKKSTAIFDYLFILMIYFMFNTLLLYPRVLMYGSSFFGIGRGVDLFLYVTVFLLFIFMVRLLLKIKKNHENISALNRKLSILLSKEEQ